MPEKAGSPAVLITPAERQRRFEASEFAKANVALEGFTQTKEYQAHVNRYIDGEIDLKAFMPRLIAKCTLEANCTITRANLLCLDTLAHDFPKSPKWESSVEFLV